MRKHSPSDYPSLLRIEVVERGKRPRKGWTPCEIDTNLSFSTEKLESYCFAPWEPVIFDAFLLTAAVEFCDRRQKRAAYHWGRDIALRLPVHDVVLWSNPNVSDTLRDALELLTGDRWSISFYKRIRKAEPPAQQHFNLPSGALSVLPYSNGLDSRIVAGLMAKKLGDNLIRVRLGTKAAELDESSDKNKPFTSVPYSVKSGEQRFAETSARSRGFKFAMLSGIAAYLSRAKSVIVPESGQGALGPTLVVVGQAYEDYRNHPLFAARMEKFLLALLDYHVHYDFPRLWHTKGETLKAYIDEYNGTSSWMNTWSCWQQSRHVSVNEKKRQCGICAACMLRRLSVHAAGATEKNETYIWDELRSASFEMAAAAGFDKVTKAQREYAIAGTLHLDHLAGLKDSPVHASPLALSAFHLGRALGIGEKEASKKLNRLLAQHTAEWHAFVSSLGANSFVANWANVAP